MNVKDEIITGEVLWVKHTNPTDDEPNYLFEISIDRKNGSDPYLHTMKVALFSEINTLVNDVTPGKQINIGRIEDTATYKGDNPEPVTTHVEINQRARRV